MKKSNVIIFILLAACSAFLLWLWYFLGFNRVDSPLDLVLSVVWWAVVIVAVVAIVKLEQVRRRRIRTVYVSDHATFNSEKGLMRFEDAAPMQDVIASILENLKYDFSRADFPDKEEFQVKYFVRSKEFDIEKRDDAQQDDVAHVTEAEAAEGEQEPQKTWKGEVVVIETKEEKPFETPEELASILAELEAAA